VIKRRRSGFGFGESKRMGDDGGIGTLNGSWTTATSPCLPQVTVGSMGLSGPGMERCGWFAGKGEADDNEGVCDVDACSTVAKL
jgi:hypothetical protein